MAALRGWASFRRVILRLERQYGDALDARGEALRRRLLGLIVEGWGRSTAVQQLLWRQAFGELREWDARQRAALLPKAWEAGAGWAGRQADAVRRYVQDAPAGDAVMQLVMGQMPGIPAADWITALEAGMLAEAARLQTAGEDAGAAVMRLAGKGAEDGRASVWEIGMLRAAASWALAVWGWANAATAMGLRAVNEQSGERMRRQAIAAIDERTTDCCLRVHGQVVGMDEPFRLTGTPRFADRMMQPPFHWHCRTAVALWHPSLEAVGVPTDEMRAAARAELEARARTGRRAVIHPAHATSRRKKN